MPVRDLTKLPLELQLLELTALMCWPAAKDTYNFNTYLLQELFGIAATKYYDIAIQTVSERFDASIEIGAWLGAMISEIGSWPALAQVTIGPGQKKGSKGKVEERIERGLITGGVFVDALKKGYGISNSAEWWCSDENILTLKQHGTAEKKLYYHPKNIHSRVWPRFKDAAHLWAAFILGKPNLPKTFRFLPLNKFYFNDPDLGKVSGIKNFVMVAEKLRQEGLVSYPKRGPRKPLLDQHTSWEVII